MPSSDPTTISALCSAYAQRMPPDHHFSHATAAILYGLPLPRRLELDARLHVTVITDGTPVRMRGVIGHQTEGDRATVWQLGELRVASPTDVWCQLSSILSLDDLVAVGDALVRRQNPYATSQELQDAVRKFAGRRGVRRLRVALSLVRAGVDSPKETMIRLMLVRGGLPEPKINLEIRNHLGAFIAFGDMAYEEFKVLVEYDGEHHFNSDEQVMSDVERLEELMEEKWRVIRFNKSHLNRESVVVGKVRRALQDAGWRPFRAPR